MTKLAGILAILMICCFMTGALVAQTPNTLTREEAAAGWRLLFDGATLKGWEMHMASATEPAATWEISDGAIFCTGSRRGWLGTVDTFTDFQLKVEFRAGVKINSGIFLRSQKGVERGIPAETGYELQIWDFRPTFKTGSLVNALEAQPITILADQWNSYDITAEGDHFIVVLNGKKVVDGRDSKHSSGVVGLQYNTGGGKIEFRNIKIRPIKH